MANPILSKLMGSNAQGAGPQMPNLIELCDTKDVAAALFVKCLIEDVDCELKQAEEKMMKLIAAGYDMIYILDEQEWLKEKYTKKTRVD